LGIDWDGKMLAEARMKLKDARELFLRAYQKKSKNLHAFQLHSAVLADFIFYIGNLDIEKFSAENVREYVASLYHTRQRYGALYSRPVSQHYAVVRNWVEWCQSRKYMKATSWAWDVEGHFQYINSRSFRSLTTGCFFICLLV